MTVTDVPRIRTASEPAEEPHVPERQGRPGSHPPWDSPNPGTRFPNEGSRRPSHAGRLGPLPSPAAGAKGGPAGSPRESGGALTALPKRPGVQHGPWTECDGKPRRGRGKTQEQPGSLQFLESSVTPDVGTASSCIMSAVNVTDTTSVPEVRAPGWGFLEAWGKGAGVAREVKAERSRGRDVYLFPTRFLVTMASIQIKTHLARCGSDCGWPAVAHLPTSYLQHTRYRVDLADGPDHQGAPHDPDANTGARRPALPPILPQ